MWSIFFTKHYSTNIHTYRSGLIQFLTQIYEICSQVVDFLHESLLGSLLALPNKRNWPKNRGQIWTAIWKPQKLFPQNNNKYNNRWIFLNSTLQGHSVPSFRDKTNKVIFARQIWTQFWTFQISSPTQSNKYQKEMILLKLHHTDIITLRSFRDKTQ